MAGRIWDDVISERDRAVYEAAGYGSRGGLGQRPALLVVDVTYDFTGDPGETILESIEKFRNSCGEAAWESLPKLRQLIEAARASGVPVIYTHASPRPNLVHVGGWARKNSRAAEPTEEMKTRGNDFPEIIAPQEGDIVIQKGKPSAFFGTQLASYLVELGVDSLLVTGTTTSGCVRATVLDGFSLNYPIVVVEEGCFDRGEVTHKINLFDMQAKYADVCPLAEALEYLDKLPTPASQPSKVAVPVKA